MAHVIGICRHSPGKATTWQDMRVTITEGYVMYSHPRPKEGASTNLYEVVRIDILISWTTRHEQQSRAVWCMVWFGPSGQCTNIQSDRNLRICSITIAAGLESGEARYRFHRTNIQYDSQSLISVTLNLLCRKQSCALNCRNRIASRTEGQ